MKPKLNNWAYFSLFTFVFCLGVAFVSKDDFMMMVNLVLAFANLTIFAVHFVSWRQDIELYTLVTKKDLDDKQIS